MFKIKPTFSLFKIEAYECCTGLLQISIKIGVLYLVNDDSQFNIGGAFASMRIYAFNIGDMLQQAVKD